MRKCNALEFAIVSKVHLQILAASNECASVDSTQTREGVGNVSKTVSWVQVRRFFKHLQTVTVTLNFQHSRFCRLREVIIRALKCNSVTNEHLADIIDSICL